jgi:anti-sigma factor RsiW
MKVIARQADEEERADLDAMLADKPELRAEFTRLEADRAWRRTCCHSLLHAPRRRGGFPPMRERLQTTVSKHSVAPNLQLRAGSSSGMGLALGAWSGRRSGGRDCGVV